jgi:mono/diheme cytochrome c family protein
MPPRARVAVFLLAGGALATGACGSGATSGADLYASTCARCHGAAGVPNDVAQKLGTPSFADAGWQQQRTDDALRKKIKNGGGRASLMPSFEALSPAEVDALVSYVRSLGPPK